LSLILVVLMALQGGVLNAQPEQPEQPAFRLTGYVLQIGAFQDEAKARVVATRISSKRLFILPIKIGEQDWYVLLYDNYATREIAERAAQQFKQDYPDMPTWIRPAELVRKVLRPISSTAAAESS
jgi:septal ring-binding cell division protein DamX